MKIPNNMFSFTTFDDAHSLVILKTNQHLMRFFFVFRMIKN